MYRRPSFSAAKTTARNMDIPAAAWFLGLPLLAAAFWLLFGMTTAFAATTANESVQNVGNSILWIPLLATRLSYGLGVIISLVGLYKLRTWVMDNERNKLSPAIYRMIVGALLIFMPHVFVVINNTFFGDGVSAGGSQFQVAPPKLFVYEKK